MSWKSAIAPAVVGAVLLGLAGSVSARSLVCESQDRDTRYCAADTRGGVTLAVQYSRASCRQGSTWGYDNRGVWVSNGCRAQFDLGDYRSRHGSDKDSQAAAVLAIGLIGAAALASQHDHDRDSRGYDYHPEDHHRGYNDVTRITCESNDERRNYCRANLRHADVDLERQLSRSACRYQSTWGWDGGGIWVSGGCRGVFTVY